jgi:hypothetical protein
MCLVELDGNGFPPPSPPAEKATACEDQARQSRTSDGAGDSFDIGTEECSKLAAD